MSVTISNLVGVLVLLALAQRVVLHGLGEGRPRRIVLVLGLAREERVLALGAHVHACSSEIEDATRFTFRSEGFIVEC